MTPDWDPEKQQLVATWSPNKLMDDCSLNTLTPGDYSAIIHKAGMFVQDNKSGTRWPFLLDLKIHPQSWLWATQCSSQFTTLRSTLAGRGSEKINRKWGAISWHEGVQVEDDLGWLDLKVDYERGQPMIPGVEEVFPKKCARPAFLTELYNWSIL